MKRECPFCRTAIEMGAAVCPQCREALGASARLTRRFWACAPQFLATLLAGIFAALIAVYSAERIQRVRMEPTQARLAYKVSEVSGGGTATIQRKELFGTKLDKKTLKVLARIIHD